jgi:hypothetical protein
VRLRGEGMEGIGGAFVRGPDAEQGVPAAGVGGALHFAVAPAAGPTTVAGRAAGRRRPGRGRAC